MVVFAALRRTAVLAQRLGTIQIVLRQVVVGLLHRKIAVNKQIVFTAIDASDAVLFFP